ncbi:single-stranded DNA-binding protein [Clostridium butyricum]|uniref:Single-stranded DNA-binding protein n=1 Tax=Clostridium butyricum TaxID=1492 RepID=A0A2S7F9K9_CLOBU|nr:single-stranded DNA-binding protein [Clostridium butyricum]ALS16900.1 single-stranded DNA-binding protein [Clostridium butyricum]KHD14365.1 single-stranded DNA-binding protein [Clostridium butyricum]MBZ5748081.1 single-stranded DNA-binding protein [Clostridium butyricum]MCQ2017457.1 single-stranded DNA-binding protein [Clostridium butyricum]MCQ2022887.1 single-stranded DNA-binding protein [Clostridium butyricum]
MNKVVLIGRLTKDPELRFTPGSGAAVTTLTLAVDRYNPKTNQNEADFIPIVIWGKQAENTANYMSKGGQVAISGKIQTRSYDAKDGTKRYITEVVADQFGGVQFLGNKGEVNQNDGSNNFGNMNQDIFEEDITPVDGGDMPF